MGPFFVNGHYGNGEIHYAYQVSPQCTVWFASLRSEEVVIGKSTRVNFFVNGAQYTCVPGFTSMHCMVC